MSSTAQNAMQSFSTHKSEADNQGEEMVSIVVEYRELLDKQDAAINKIKSRKAGKKSNNTK